MTDFRCLLGGGAYGLADSWEQTAGLENPFSPASIARERQKTAFYCSWRQLSRRAHQTSLVLGQLTLYEFVRKRSDDQLESRQIQLRSDRRWGRCQ